MRADVKKKAVENLLDEAPSRTKLRFDNLPSDNLKFNNITKVNRGPDIGDADEIYRRT
jgi:hypothetical protein